MEILVKFDYSLDIPLAIGSNRTATLFLPTGIFHQNTEKREYDKVKNIYRTSCWLVIGIMLVACGRLRATISTAPPVSEPTITPGLGTTATATAMVTVTARSSLYLQPTLIPTIEPAKIPDLLKNSLSIQTLSAFSGHNLRRITGWSNGFNSGLWDHGSRDRNQGYLWMNASHLLLFPATGEILEPNWSTITARPVVMNLDTGKIWLPPTDRSLNDGRWFSIIMPRWSPKLQLLVTGENLGQQEGTSTYTADGKRASHFKGQLVDISPSAERIFVAGDTWIDLVTGKKVDFGWGPGFGYEVERWFPIWSRDESQIYFCCYYYGNARTGQSYTITNENTIFDGGPFVNMHSLRHAYGVWLNDRVVMPIYDAWWYEGPDFSTIFDVKERTYHNLGIVAGLPDSFNNHTYSQKIISPNGEYMYISPGAISQIDPQIYLVDLKTLKSQLYHVGQVDWSADGKYAIMDSQVLTLASKTLQPLPARPDSERLAYWIANAWHPTAGARLSIYADKQQHQYLYLLDVEQLTYRHLSLPSNFDGTYSTSTNLTWSPKGDRFALAAADGSLWQMDYPKFENLEQLSPPMANVKDVSWSPDGQYLAYVGGTDIYIVDVGSNP